MRYVCYYVSLLLVHHSRQFCLPKKFKNQDRCHHFVHFWPDISNYKFCANFFLKYFYMHGIYFLTKGAASICRYYIFATGSPLFPPINKSQYLTSTYFSPQSKHFKKKCQPKY